MTSRRARDTKLCPSDLYSMYCEVQYIITVLALPLGMEICFSPTVSLDALHRNPCVPVNLSFDLSLSVQMLGAECRKHQMDLPGPHSDSHWGE